MLKIIKFSSAALAAFATVLFGVAMIPVGSADAQEFTLRLSHPVPPVAAPHRFFLTPWVKLIEEQSGGRIKIEIIPANGLGGSSATLIDKVVDGTADIVWTLPAYTPGRFPKSETFELPGLFAGPVATNQALWDFYNSDLIEEFSDVKVLLLHTHAGQAFMSTKPIRSAADLKGMAVRTPGNTGTLWLKAAGANPVQAPVPAIPELLSRNTVQAVMIPFEIAPAFKVHELTKYVTTLPNDGRIHTAVFLFAMNKDTYNSLPPDLQKVIDDNSGANLSVKAGEIWVGIEKPGQDLARADGDEFIELGPAAVAEFEAIGAKAVAAWIEENKGKFDAVAMVEKARRLLAKYAD